MAAGKKVASLVGKGEPSGALLTLDPGATTGYCVYMHGDWTAGRLPLAELAHWLRVVDAGSYELVGCEAFILRGAKARQQAGSDMPAPRGIGMIRSACDAAGVDLFMMQTVTKRAGKMALDAGGKACRARCKSEHERDAVDLMGFLLREMRRPLPTIRTRR